MENQKSQFSLLNCEENPWAPLGFRLETTGDGSQTLHSLKEKGESMHHYGGALSESRLIYGQVIEKALSFFSCPRVLSVGLGLGYNEILAVALALKFQKSVQIFSFEIVEGLRQGFRDFFLEPKGLQDSRAITYEKILNLVACSCEVPPESLRQAVRESLQNKEILLFEDIIPTISIGNSQDKVEVILYDAFSQKVDAPLWQEDFLSSLFSSWCEADAVVATYACTGALKRALKKENFQLAIREGFLGKRNSTRGGRGIFADQEWLES